MASVTDRIFEVVTDEGVAKRSRRSTLARICGISPQAVRDWEEGATKNVRHEHIAAIAKEYGISIDWLITGQGERKVADAADSFEFRRIPADVPLISTVQAGSWDEAEDNGFPGDAEQYLPCVAPHSAMTFALRVEGDSMTSPSGKSYPDGTIIFVDPEQRGGARPGDRVVAKLNGDNAVTFKQLAEDRDGLFLKPLNPSHEPIFAEFRILGKVIGAWMPE